MLTDILKKLSKTDFGKYAPSSTIRLLFDIQMWLMASQIALVEVFPVDDWGSFSYRIALPDKMAPFFEPEYDRGNEFDSYEKALEAGIFEALNLTEL